MQGVEEGLTRERQGSEAADGEHRLHIIETRITSLFESMDQLRTTFDAAWMRHAGECETEWSQLTGLTESCAHGAQRAA